MAVPRMLVGWLSRIAVRVLSAMHSTKPSPSVLSDVRKVVMFSALLGRRSCMEASMARSLMSEPPGASTNLVVHTCGGGHGSGPHMLLLLQYRLWPALSSLIWAMAPVTGFWWHSRQDCAL